MVRVIFVRLSFTSFHFDRLLQNFVSKFANLLFICRSVTGMLFMFTHCRSKNFIVNWQTLTSTFTWYVPVKCTGNYHQLYSRPGKLKTSTLEVL